MTATSEQWRAVVGYEGFYEVSDQGRVRSVDRLIVRSDGQSRKWRGRLLASATEPDGRRQVSLTIGGRGRTFRVSVLVLEAFVGPRPEGMYCCHNNGICTDDRPENLRWDTPSGNEYDQVLHGTHHLANKTHCPRRHPLVAPNLIPSALRKGGRGCLACSRAKSRWHKARRQGYTFPFEPEADSIFAQIMQEAS